MSKDTGNIVDMLGMMCSADDQHDKKLMLLAQLVDTKCNSIVENQQRLQDCLDDTNAKLDKLSALLEKEQRLLEECPVYRHRDLYDGMTLFAQNPRLSILLLIGLLVLLGGFLGYGIDSLLERFL